VRILKNSWFEKFARKQEIGDAALLDAVARAGRGLMDADLGGGVLKQRVAREGEGKSGGYRTIILFSSGVRAVFVFGFAKSDRANLTAKETKTYKKAAALVLDLRDEQIEAEVVAGRLFEVRDD
jgi:hypothetical protein